MRIVLAAGLQVAKAGAGQFGQVIVNMVIIARDSMPNGGKLPLETANVTFGAWEPEGYTHSRLKEETLRIANVIRISNQLK